MMCSVQGAECVGDGIQDGEAAQVAKCVGGGEDGAVPVAVLVSTGPINEAVEALEISHTRRRADQTHIDKLRSEITALKERVSKFRTRFLSSEEHQNRRQVRGQISLKEKELKDARGTQARHVTLYTRALYKVCLLFSNTLKFLKRVEVYGLKTKHKFSAMFGNIVAGRKNLQTERCMWVQIATTEALAVETKEDEPILLYPRYIKNINQQIASNTGNTKLEHFPAQRLPERFRAIVQQLDTKLQLSHVAQKYANAKTKRLQDFSQTFTYFRTVVACLYSYCTTMCAGSPSVWKRLHNANCQVAVDKISYLFRHIGEAQNWMKKHGIVVKRTVEDKTILTIDDVLFIVNMYGEVRGFSSDALLKARTRLKTISGSDEWAQWNDTC